jgi:drug/metabolite transporter (DMT)-like permease
VILKKIGTAQDGIFVTRRIFFYSILTMLPALPLTGYRMNLAPLLEPAVLLNLLFLTLLASCAGFLLWNRVIWALGAVKSSNFIYLSPAITLVSSALMLGESVTAWAVGGMALILLGVNVAENAGRRKALPDGMQV